MVSLEQAVAQIVQLGDAVTGLKKDVQDLQAENLDLRAQLRNQAGQAAGQAGAGNRYEKSELRSLKAIYPDKFKPKEDVFQT